MINVTKTHLPDIDRYKAYIDRIYRSGWITNNGALVQELEEKLKEYLGVRNILLVSNGTLALQICYKALGLTGEAITTPFSFVATTSSLVWEGLSPVFVDISPETLNMDPDRIEEAIRPETSCIVPVHVFGNGCDVEKIGQIAKKHHLKVVYDAAHAFGVKYNGESILNYGDVSILSFHATKFFHTIEGGAIVTGDDELYEKAKHMINFGITGPESIVGLGINGKMNEFQAAMGLCILEDIDQIIDSRKRLYEYYKEQLSAIDGLQFPKQNERSTPNYSYFPVLFDCESSLLKVMEHLMKNEIVPRRYFYPSLDRLPYVKSPEMLISNDIARRILCLPFYEGLSPDWIDRICRLIREGLAC